LTITKIKKIRLGKFINVPSHINESCLIIYFFAILGGSLKNTDAKSTANVPISKKVYTSVSMTS